MGGRKVQREGLARAKAQRWGRILQPLKEGQCGWGRGDPGEAGGALDLTLEVKHLRQRRTVYSLTWCRVEHEGKTGQSGAALDIFSPDLTFMTMSYSTAGCCLLLTLRQLSRFSDLDSALCLRQARSCNHWQALCLEVSILSMRSELDILNTPWIPTGHLRALLCLLWGPLSITYLDGLCWALEKNSSLWDAQFTWCGVGIQWVCIIHMAWVVDSHILPVPRNHLRLIYQKPALLGLQTTQMICVLSKHDTWALSDPVEKNTESDLV